MKKYNLVIKESVIYINREDFPELTVGNKGFDSYKMLFKTIFKMDCKPFSFKLHLEKNKVDKGTTFTQQEIDKLPHGFVKLFDIIEAKEELYYIKMPYSNGCFLNQDASDGDVIYSNEHEVMGYQTKFTLDYIKETFPLFLEFAVKVEEEE